jgi:hypothetical protein
MELLLTLKESEDLIFNRHLILGNHRLDIAKIKDNLSIKVEFSKDEIILIDGGFILLFSSVTQFEIPEKDFNLFFNHYRIPKGYLKPIKRIVRDKIGKSDLPFFKKDIDISNYLPLRSGLVGLYDFTVKNSANDDLKKGFHELISTFNEISDFKSNFLKIVFSSKDFPLLVINMDRFVPDNFYRIVWWGKIIKDNLLGKIENIDDSRISEISLWLKSFLNFENINYSELLNTKPREFDEEYDFIVGYYIAILNFELIKQNDNFFSELYSNNNFKGKGNIICWSVFFYSIFNTEIPYLYFISSLRKDIYEIEKISCHFGNKNLEYQEKSYRFFNYEISKNTIITEYLSLTRNTKNTFIEEIEYSEILPKIKNNLCYENLNNIVFEIEPNYYEQKKINFCFSTKDGFTLGLIKSVNFENLVFYCDTEPTTYLYLKLLKGIHVKPINKLINPKKKVLVGFIENNHDTPMMFRLYASLIKSSKKKLFDKILVVFMVDLDQEKLHSLEFDNFIRQEQIRISDLFNQDIELIIRNKRNPSKVEIKRNINNVLSDYTIHEIEVIDENLDEEKASWIIESGTDYWISKPNQNLSSFLNMDIK